MAKFNYAKSQNTADKLITKFGALGQLLVYTKGVGGARPTYTPRDVQMAVLEYDNRQVDGTRIKATDKMIYLSAKGIAEIKSTDRLRDAEGIEYEIVPPVKPLKPAGTTVYFEVQGRA